MNSAALAAWLLAEPSLVVRLLACHPSRVPQVGAQVMLVKNMELGGSQMLVRWLLMSGV